MKKTLTKSIIMLALIIAASPMWVGAAVTVYAEETVSNVTATAPESGPASAVPAPSANRADNNSPGNPPVRVDKTGVHIGGANPVDINVPELTHVRREKAIDWEAIISQCVCVFGLPVAVVAIALSFKYRRNKMAHETLRMMIEKGMPVTPELVASLKGRCGPGGDGFFRGRPLLPGLILLGIGTALVLSGRGDVKAGWIISFIGLAFLVVWLVERKNPSNQQPPR